MMLLSDFVFLAADTARSRAYLQVMLKNSLKPSYCLIFSDMELKNNNAASEKPFFDIDKSLVYSLQEAGIPYSIIKTRDINSEILVEKISELEQSYIIYSGYGGGILKKPLFTTGKKFIHVHAGLLPQYRGSTTAYYSILNDGTISATAFFLNEKIDEGDIITEETFSVPKGVDVDYIYEPYIRACVLVKALKRYLENDCVFKTSIQDPAEGETYFIMHPVLKHLAIMKIS